MSVFTGGGAYGWLAGRNGEFPSNIRQEESAPSPSPFLNTFFFLHKISVIPLCIYHLSQMIFNKIKDSKFKWNTLKRRRTLSRVKHWKKIYVEYNEIEVMHQEQNCKWACGEGSSHHLAKSQMCHICMSVCIRCVGLLKLKFAASSVCTWKLYCTKFLLRIFKAINR